MCLYTYKVGNVMPTAKVATTDIVVYKIIFKNNESFYKYFEYTPNTLYRLRKPLVPIKEDSYRCYKIERGFHSYEKNTDSIFSNLCKKVKFIIPKGAKYFCGHNGDIVSTSIRSGSLRALTS